MNGLEKAINYHEANCLAVLHPDQTNHLFLCFHHWRCWKKRFPVIQGFTFYIDFIYFFQVLIFLLPTAVTYFMIIFILILCRILTLLEYISRSLDITCVPNALSCFYSGLDGSHGFTSHFFVLLYFCIAFVVLLSLQSESLFSSPSAQLDTSEAATVKINPFLLNLWVMWRKWFYSDCYYESMQFQF